MNLATTIELHAYGTSEGAIKGWEYRARKEADTYEERSHVVREPNPWQSGSGLQKTGTKEAGNAMNKVRYFARARGFKHIGSQRDAGKMGSHAGRQLAEHYMHKNGATLTAYHDTALNRVTAHLNGPPQAHTDFDQTMGRRDIKKMMYEMALKEWAGSPQQQAIVGSIEIYASAETICVDFDDTLKEGAQLAPEGIKLAKWILVQGFKLVILTAAPRSWWNKMNAMLAAQGVKASSVTDVKPEALAYVDNKGVHWCDSASQAIKDIKHIMKRHV